MGEQMRELMTQVSDFVPLDIRPDVSELVEHFIFKTTKSDITTWKGHMFQPPFDATIVEWQYDNWMPRNGYVLIASFPKTGTTWMNEIVKQLYYRDNEEMMKIAKKITPFYSYLEAGIPVKYEIVDKLPLDRRVFNTHIPATLLNMERIKKSGCKVIYMLRNPKDVLLSWYKMAENLPFNLGKNSDEMFPKDWNSFFETFITGKQAMHVKEGEWYPDHILTWYHYRNDDNVRFVMYEDMKKNPQKEIRGVADFLGVNISDDEISQVVTDTSFNKMNGNATEFQKNVHFFRKGQVGDWKNHFTVAQSELMDQKFNEKLSHISDIKFTYVLPN